jgi:hypothetical protein
MNAKVWLAALITAFISATEAAPLDPDASQTPLGTFGNWRVFSLASNDSVNLFGTSTGSKSGYFQIQCHKDHVYTLLIPFMGIQRIEGARTLTKGDHLV